MCLPANIWVTSWKIPHTEHERTKTIASTIAVSAHIKVTAGKHKNRCSDRMNPNVNYERKLWVILSGCVLHMFGCTVCDLTAAKCPCDCLNRTLLPWFKLFSISVLLSFTVCSPPNMNLLHPMHFFDHPLVSLVIKLSLCLPPLCVHYFLFTPSFLKGEMNLYWLCCLSFLLPGKLRCWFDMCTASQKQKHTRWHH